MPISPIPQVLLFQYSNVINESDSEPTDVEQTSEF